MGDYTLSNLLEIQFLLDFGKGKALGHSTIGLPSSHGALAEVGPLL